MADKDQQPKQPTRPKKGKPIEIPVPKRRDVEDALRKLALPKRPEK
jgi:hypothetical protein